MSRLVNDISIYKSFILPGGVITKNQILQDMFRDKFGYDNEYRISENDTYIGLMEYIENYS